jgi:glycerol kinase
VILAIDQGTTGTTCMVFSEELRADGGATANAWMLQFQADLLGVPVVVPEISETTALGAAYLAGVATGAWTEDDVRAMWTEAARYEPAMGEDERAALLDGWRRAVVTTRNHSR